MWQRLLRWWYARWEQQLDAWEREIQREEIRLNLAAVELYQQERELADWEARFRGGTFR